MVYSNHAGLTVLDKQKFHANTKAYLLIDLSLEDYGLLYPINRKRKSSHS